MSAPPPHPQAQGTYIEVWVLAVQLRLAPSSTLLRPSPRVPVPVIWFQRTERQQWASDWAKRPHPSPLPLTLTGDLTFKPLLFLKLRLLLLCGAVVLIPKALLQGCWGVG